MTKKPTKPEAAIIKLEQADLARQDWIATRDELLAAAGAIVEIADHGTYEAATQQVTELRRHRKDLADHRLSITRQFDDLKRQFMTQEKELGDELDAEQDRLKKIAGEYATRIARERAEAERKRQEAEAAAALAAAEAAAEAERKRQKAERAAEAAVAAGEPPPRTPEQIAHELFGTDAPPQPEPEPAPEVPAMPVVPEAPAATRAAAGVRQVKVYKFEIVDPTALDHKFLSPDEQKVRAFVQYCKSQGIAPEAIMEPGLRVWEEVAIR